MEIYDGISEEELNRLEATYLLNRIHLLAGQLAMAATGYHALAKERVTIMSTQTLRDGKWVTEIEIRP